MQHGVLVHDGAQQLRHLAREGAQVERLHDEASLAGVGKQLARQVGRALRGAFDVEHGGPHRRTLVEIEQREGGIGEHAHEQVVEVVRNAAGEQAQGFELLRVMHFRVALRLQLRAADFGA